MPDGTDAVPLGGPPALPDWNPDVDDTLVCRAVRQETRDVKTFVFAPRHPCLFRFRPGQFLTLELPIGGGTVQRSYTIASSAARPFRLAITVKRVPGGPVSNWLHDTVKPGDTIRAVGPLGDFTPGERAGAGKYLFLSGGSGITPLMSMARTFDDLGEDHDVVFVHAARTPADIIFRKELDTMAARNPGLRIAHVCEATDGEREWAGHTGRLSLPMLRLIAPDLLEREVYVCGPSPFMAAVRGCLLDAGFPMERHHQESFNFEELTAGGGAPSRPAVPAESPVAAATHRVEFARLGRTVHCPADTTIVAAAEAAGIRLPVSCSQGLCGTCKTKLLSGTVEMTHKGGIRKREVDQGLVLLCCSRPTSDVVVDR
ncbi:2Fe-2S iron-sulfur cluster-binding protein [Azospirillum sp. ST 5-10]|uniref:2Fe-2S iron-sulfur cluster-binding protein n=1 Tax=unclassified Azospirillum TaxID=2630922 RepID=UPI003F49BF9E